MLPTGKVAEQAQVARLTAGAPDQSAMKFNELQKASGPGWGAWLQGRELGAGLVQAALLS